MRKLLLTLSIIMALAVSVPVLSQEFMIGSGNKTADALIYTGACYLHGIVVATDGTNAVTVAIYDNTSGSGTLLMPSTVVTSSATDRVRTFSFIPRVKASNGIYVDITIGAGSAAYVVYYSP